MPEFVQVTPRTGDAEHPLPFYVEVSGPENQLHGFVRGWEVDVHGNRISAEKVWKRGRNICRAIPHDTYGLVPV